jgi:hypothetical protein
MTGHGYSIISTTLKTVDSFRFIANQANSSTGALLPYRGAAGTH